MCHLKAAVKTCFTAKILNDEDLIDEVFKPGVPDFSWSTQTPPNILPLNSVHSILPPSPHSRTCLLELPMTWLCFLSPRLISLGLNGSVTCGRAQHLPPSCSRWRRRIPSWAASAAASRPTCSACGAATSARAAGSSGYSGGGMTPTLLTWSIMISQVGARSHLPLVTERILGLLGWILTSVPRGALSLLLSYCSPNYYSNVFSSPWSFKDLGFQGTRVLLPICSLGKKKNKIQNTSLWVLAASSGESCAESCACDSRAMS